MQCSSKVFNKTSERYEPCSNVASYVNRAYHVSHWKNSNDKTPYAYWEKKYCTVHKLCMELEYESVPPDELEKHDLIILPGFDELLDDSIYLMMECLRVYATTLKRLQDEQYRHGYKWLPYSQVWEKGYI